MTDTYNSRFLKELNAESDENWKGSAYIRELKLHLRNLVITDSEQRVGGQLSDKVRNERFGIDESDIHVGKLKIGDKTIKPDAYFSKLIFFDDKDKAFNLGFLFEAKNEQDLYNVTYRSKVILQAISYLHDIKNSSLLLPPTVLIGNKNNCFVIPTNDIMVYIDSELFNTVNKAASSIHNDSSFKPMIDSISADEALQNYINTHIFKFVNKPSVPNEINNLKSVAEQIYKICKDDKITQPVTSANIQGLYDYFSTRIINNKQKDRKGKEKMLTNREMVSLFMHLITDTDSCGTSKNNIIICDKSYKGNAGLFKAFIQQYEFHSVPLDVSRNITAIADRLIEDSDRRFKGDYYTPAIFVDAAHNLVSKHLGDDWRQTYAVWDCCWGTGNLTRDYQYNCLLCSTLSESDLEIGYSYNPEAVKIQYDFLKDDVKLFDTFNTKLTSDKLQYLFENDLIKCKLFEDEDTANYVYNFFSMIINKQVKGLVFFVNPPYATSKSGGTKTERDKKGVVGEDASYVGALMQQDNWGKARQQLYMHFIYRMIKIGEFLDIPTTLAMFTPPLYLSGGSNEDARREIGYTHTFLDGFMFPADEFSDTASGWGISFTLLGDKKQFNGLELPGGSFPLKLLKSVDNQTSIEPWLFDGQDTKNVWNLDGKKTLRDWALPVEKVKSADAPQLTSACKWHESLDYYKKNGELAQHLGRIDPNALGFLLINANNIEQAFQLTGISSSCMSGGHGVSIMPSNFVKASIAHTVRKLATKEAKSDVKWIYSKDEFLAPSEKIEKTAEFQLFKADCLVWSIFGDGANQSSLRNMEYNDRSDWFILNHYFWMSSEEIRALANVHRNTETFNDLREYQEDKRFVGKPYGSERVMHLMLKGQLALENGISEDAKSCLDIASDLVRDTFKYRKAFNNLIYTYNKKDKEYKDGYIEVEVDCSKYQVNNWDASWYQIKAMIEELIAAENYLGLTKDEVKNIQSKYEKFKQQFKQFSDRLRPLVYELGFLYK